MLTDEEKDILALYGVPGVGSQTHARLVAQFGSPGNVFRTTEKELISMDGIGKKTAASILNFDRDTFVERQMKLMRECDVTMLTRSSETYPALLNVFKSAPPVLFVRGDADVLSMDTIAFVGTRRATDYGVRITRKLVAGCVEAGMCIVSGMAAGIDAASHRAALDSGGKTAAVFGCGVDIIYPLANKKLSEDILKSGCLISHFPMGTPGEPGNFPARNSVVAGMSMGTVVVEAPEPSGALITAELTLKAGRKLFTVPANADSDRSMGSNKLIAHGAHPVIDADGILAALGKHTGTTRVAEGLSAPQSRPMPKGLAGEILGVLDRGPLQIEEIQAALERPVHEISSELTTLEIDHFVSRKPGNYFERL